MYRFVNIIIYKSTSIAFSKRLKLPFISLHSALLFHLVIPLRPHRPPPPPFPTYTGKLFQPLHSAPSLLSYLAVHSFDWIYFFLSASSFHYFLRWHSFHFHPMPWNPPCTLSNPSTVFSQFPYYLSIHLLHSVHLLHLFHSDIFIQPALFIHLFQFTPFIRLFH